MDKPQLVAIEHDPEYGVLIHRSCVPLFEKSVIPYMKDNCVFVIEGGADVGIVRPEDNIYKKYYPNISFLGPYDKYPVMYSKDAMHDEVKMTSELLRESAQSSQAIVDTLTEQLYFEYLPDSWSEMIRCIAANSHKVRLRKDMGSDTSKALQKLTAIFSKRDEHFAEQIYAFQSSNNQVFFIGGMLHCVNLTAKHGWDVIKYKLSPKTIRSLYRLWYICYQCHSDHG